ncbi:uncharacterized protein [Dysidea avara]|uniref:uncharacterized protein n=1 Tax=Dysidea avara TaxID=196820 RepID=UPI003317E43E
MAEAAVTPAYRTLCSHYSRGCSLLAPCCGRVYPCRICHDEAEEHKMDHRLVETIQCRNCSKLQEVTNKCVECSTVFSEAYFCQHCRLFDDKDKQQFHCDQCTICRVGGRDNYFHCSKCNLCWLTSFREAHKCKSNATHSVCPVCMEDVHSSRDNPYCLPCDHYLHRGCYGNLLENGLYKCPLCNTSMVDMTEHWKRLDEERKEWPMPRRYRNFTIKVLCQDCHETTTTQFHVIGLKCQSCGSYNTSRCGNEEIPAESESESEEDDDDDEIEEDARLALLQQRLSTMVSRLNRSMERRNNNSNPANSSSDRTQEMMLHSFVDQLQLFQGLLNEISGNYDDADEGPDSSEDTSTSEESDGEGTKESDVSESSNDLEADDEGDSSNPHSPSYSFFSHPHPINLEDIYGTLGEEDDSSNSSRDDRSSSWETEEEQEVIGEVGSSNWGDSSYGDHDNSGHDNNLVSHDISNISGSLGTVTLDCLSDSDGSDVMMNELPIIPPLRWNLGGAPMLLPFHANINFPSLIPNNDSSDSSSNEEESRVNCNVQ